MATFTPAQLLAILQADGHHDAPYFAAELQAVQNESAELAELAQDMGNLVAFLTGTRAGNASRQGCTIMPAHRGQPLPPLLAALVPVGGWQ